MPDTFPITAVVATRDRPEALRRMLDSLWQQEPRVSECIVVDASAASRPLTLEVCEAFGPRLIHVDAERPGAAPQRNQGVQLARQPNILFLDDDVILEAGCLTRLWEALEARDQHGAAGSMLTNQTYHPPGRYSRILFRWLHGRPLASYAGRCLGPGLAQLPSDDPSLPSVVEVDWLNAGCTLYRREALPSPPFPALFQGASTAEDLALSLTVGKHWTLVNARHARVYHDSQPGAHKRSVLRLSAMEIVNKHHIMRNILGRHGAGDYLRFVTMMTFQFIGTLRQPQGLKMSSQRLAGYGVGFYRILRSH